MEESTSNDPATLNRDDVESSKEGNEPESWLPARFYRALKPIADIYASRNTEFPADECWKIFLREGMLPLAISGRFPTNRGRSSKLLLREAEELLRHVKEVQSFLSLNEVWGKDKYPDLSDAISRMASDLQEELSDLINQSQKVRDFCLAMKEAGWIFDEDTGKIKASQIEGVGNRGRELKNEMICKLYDCLRKPFDVGWPEYAGVRNPELLRKHIRGLLGAFFHPDEIDPRANGPVWQAVQNHTKKPR